MLATSRPLEVLHQGGSSQRPTSSQTTAGDRTLLTAPNPDASDVNAVSRRMPKIMVRNAIHVTLPTDDVTGFADECPREDFPMSSPFTQPSPPAVRPIVSRGQSERSQDSQDTTNTTDRRQHRDKAYAALNTGTDERRVGKKAAAVLGFLTLKEPSAAAWEQFAETQKKAAAQKGCRLTAAGFPGVSTQKLPDHVPKTNSKWDDRDRPKSKDSKRRPTSATSKASSRRTQSSSSQPGQGTDFAKSFGSLSSRPGRKQSTSSSGSSRRPSAPNTSCSTHVSEGSGDVQRPPTTEPTMSASQRDPAVLSHRHVPLSTAVHPVHRDRNVAPWVEPEDDGDDGVVSPETRRVAEPESMSSPNPSACAAPSSPRPFLHPPSPLPIQSEPLRYELSGYIEPSRPSLDAFESNTSAESSPLTPHAHDGFALPSLDANWLTPHHFSGSENATFLHSDTDTDTETIRSIHTSSKSINFSRPVVARPMSPHKGADLPLAPIFDATTEEEEEEEVNSPTSFLPTLRDAQGRSSPFISPDPFEKAAPPSLTSVGLSDQRKPSSSTSKRPLLTPPNADANTSAIPTTTTTYAPTLSSSSSESLPRPSTSTSTFSTSTSCPPRSRSNSDAASEAPSEISAQWKLTPKERLGLGGKLTVRGQPDVLPWEMDEDEGGMGAGTEDVTAAAAKRKSTATQFSVGGGMMEGGKLKRLSLRLGRR